MDEECNIPKKIKKESKRDTRKKKPNKLDSGLKAEENRKNMQRRFTLFHLEGPELKLR